jgi:predicted PhzF superfamily epimerase YddE/YHI9
MTTNGVLVDVFGSLPCTGNSRAVPGDAPGLAARRLLRIRRDVRRFAAVCVGPAAQPSVAQARAFDPFAGLPLAARPATGGAADCTIAQGALVRTLGASNCQAGPFARARVAAHGTTRGCQTRMRPSIRGQSSGATPRLLPAVSRHRI